MTLSDEPAAAPSALVPGEPFDQRTELDKLEDLRKLCRPMEQRFAQDLVAGDWKVGRAYARLFPDRKSPDVAGWRMLNRPHVRAYADAMHRFLAAQAGVTAMRTLQELGRMAFANVQDLVDPTTGEVIPPHELPRDVAAAVQEFEVVEKLSKPKKAKKGGRPAKPVVVSRTVKYKLANKHDPLKTIAHHFNMLNPDRQLPQNPSNTTNNILVVAGNRDEVTSKIDKLLEGIGSRLEEPSK